MSPTFTMQLGTWAVLSMAVLGLAVFRMVVSWGEDDTLHVRECESNQALQQGLLASKLLQIDRWGKILTAVAFVWGLGLAVWYVYQSWLENNAAAISMR